MKKPPNKPKTRKEKAIARQKAIARRKKLIKSASGDKINWGRLETWD